MAKNEFINNSSDKLLEKAKELKGKLFSDDQKKLEDLKNSVLGNDKMDGSESLILDGSLEDSVFADEDELDLFKKRSAKNMFMEVKSYDNLNRDKTKFKCISTVKQGKNPDKYKMKVPSNLDDVKVSDIPYLVKQINIAVFGNDIESLPDWSSYKEIAVYIQSLIDFLSDNGKTDLVQKYQELYKNYFSDFICSVDENIKLSFQTKCDLENHEIDDDIQSDLSFLFKKKLFESVFEGGKKILYENMKAPNSDEYGSLLESFEKENLQLQKARQTGNVEKIVKAEKKLVEKIYSQVSQYQDFEKKPHNYSLPVDVLLSKEMLCLSKSALQHGLFDYFGIENQVYGQNLHVYNVVTLSDGGEYIVDAWYDDKYDREENKVLSTLQQKILYKSGESMSADDVLMSDMLHGMMNWGSVGNDDIIGLQLAVKINPKNVWVFIALGYCYEDLGTPEDQKTAYGYHKKALEVLTETINENGSVVEESFWKIQSTIYRNLYYLNKENSFEEDVLEYQKKMRDFYDSKTKK